MEKIKGKQQTLAKWAERRPSRVGTHSDPKKSEQGEAGNRVLVTGLPYSTRLQKDYKQSLVEVAGTKKGCIQ